MLCRSFLSLSLAKRLSTLQRLRLFGSRCQVNSIATPCASLPFTPTSCQPGLVLRLTRRDILRLQVIARRLLSQSPSRRNAAPSSGGGPDREDGGDKNKNEDGGRRVNAVAFFGGLFMTYIVYSLLSQPDSQIDEEGAKKMFVTWNTFLYEMLAKGEVKRIIVRPSVDRTNGEAKIELQPGAVLSGKRAPSTVFYMTVRDIDRFEFMLREAEKRLGVDPLKSVNLIYDPIASSAWAQLFALLIIAGLIVGVGMLLGRMMRKSMSEFMSNLTSVNATKMGGKYGSGKTPRVKFKDVAGLREAKQEVMEFVDYLKHPKKFTALGAKLPKGGLLLGPPGCGKTLLAKAVAAEANVPFFAVNGTDFVEVIGGVGAARVRDLFKEAKGSTPCIIHIDEIDALGRSRSGEGDRVAMSNDEHEQTLNQLLVSMDGMETNQGVLVLASTNRADVLDKALLRRGRFDRHINIDLPTKQDRVEIFELYLRQLPKLDPDVWNQVKRFAEQTPGFSGADIRNVCNEAALRAANQLASVVTVDDIDRSMEKVIFGSQKRTSALSPEEKRVIAYHECGHALVGWLLKETDALLKISIVPRTGSAMGFSQYAPADIKLYTKEQLFERIAMTLGGRAAESVVFNRVSSGAEDDLKKVTRIAYDQVRRYGMSERLGLLSFGSATGQPENEFQKKPYSKKLQRLMDMEAREIVVKAYESAETLLRGNKAKLDKLAQALLERESLLYEDISALIGPPPFGSKQTVSTVEQSLPPAGEDAETSSGKS